MTPFQWTLYAVRHPEMQVPVVVEQPFSHADLALVNDEVNRNIKAMPGMPEVSIGWEENRSPGWCGDYAVTKRALLIRLGWPTARALMAHVITATGEHHAVLVCDDLVLDNRVDAIRSRKKCGYKGVSIQTAENPNYWRDAAGLFR